MSLLVATEIWLAVGCGTESDGRPGGSPSVRDPLAVAVTDAPPSPWEDTGLPYGGREDDGKVWRLSFRGQSVLLPATDPAWTEAAEVKPGDELPALELSTAGATADAGLFQLTPPGRPSQLWQLSSNGTWQQIASGMSKIALADVNGHLVTWVQGAGEDGLKSDDAKVVAFDTSLGAVVGELPGEDVPGNYLRVTAVDDDGIIVQGIEGTENEHLTRNFLWRPSRTANSLTKLTDGEPDDLVTVTAYDDQTGLRVVISAVWESARLAGPETNGMRELGFDGFGQFNSDATQLVATGYGQALLLNTSSMQPVELDLPTSSLKQFVPGAFAWTADDRLAVIGSVGNKPQEAFLCTTATGSCERLGFDYLWFSSIENSARGQAAYHAEPEGD